MLYTKLQGETCVNVCGVCSCVCVYVYSYVNVCEREREREEERERERECQFSDEISGFKVFVGLT